MEVYICAQLLGGIVGAAIVYANYFHAIDIFEGGRGVRTLSTASLFSSYTVRPVLQVRYTTILTHFETA